MGFNSFDEIISAVKARRNKKRCAVVAAESDHTLEAVLEAYSSGIIEPVLIGNESMIKEYLERMAGGAGKITIISASTDEESAQKAVDLVHAGKADCLMKGRLETATLMRAVISDKKMRTGNIMSAMAVLELPAYHKILAMTDGGITLFPDLNQKRMIMENALGALRSLGVSCPKVAILAAVERVNPKIPDTVDAAELKKMNERGEIKGCIIDGPMQLDAACSAEAARLKGVDSPIAGDPDLLLWPDITSGNLAGKAITMFGRAKSGICILGAKVPIIAASRAASAQEKFLSIVVATAIAGN